MDYLDRVFFILDSSGAALHEQLCTETLCETHKKNIFFCFQNKQSHKKKTHEQHTGPFIKLHEQWLQSWCHLLLILKAPKFIYVLGCVPYF